MDILNMLLKTLYMNFIMDVVYIKIINYKNEMKFKHIICIICENFIITILGFIIAKHISVIIEILIVYFIKSFINAKITNNKFSYSLMIIVISFSMTYIASILAILFTGIITNKFSNFINKNSIIIFCLISVIEYFLLYLFFKIKRFKNGIIFLQNKKIINNIGRFGIIIMGIALLMYSMIKNSNRKEINAYLLAGTIIEAFCIIIWLKKKLTKYYKQKLKENTIEIQEEEIKQKDELINLITDENQKLATINHKYSSRIKALEKVSTKIFSNPEIMEKIKTEFGKEFGDIQKQIQSISEEFTNEMDKNINIESNLPRTGVFGIDNILDYMNNEAKNNNIEFELKINGSINYMVENVIEQKRLETLLGDHIKDSIIAINNSDNKYRNILVVLGIVEGCYEVCIYDTGIEFEIDTLLKLGKEQITTHKDTGGSGIGFITTFETLKETKASLIIEEKHEMIDTDYTKAVRIRFDGKEEYRICSYRDEQIRELSSDNTIILRKFEI